MAYLDNYNLLTSEGDLWRKALWATFKAATDIKNEDSGTANHANRLTWANAALASLSALEAAEFELRLKVLENATIQTNGHASSDADVQFVVNGSIDSVATG